jgi:hypothetical protein
MYEPKLNQHIDGSVEFELVPLAGMQLTIFSLTDVGVLVLPALEVAPVVEAAKATWVVTRP